MNILILDRYTDVVVAVLPGDTDIREWFMDFAKSELFLNWNRSKVEAEEFTEDNLVIKTDGIDDCINFYGDNAAIYWNVLHVKDTWNNWKYFSI